MDTETQHLTKFDGDTIDWINLKLRWFNWTKVKLKDWNKFWSYREGVICIFALKVNEL